MKNRRVLDGIKVLDLSRLYPGPYCSMILADHGAEVISIESNHYKNDFPVIYTINRNKRHMTLNLKTEEGRNIIHRLVKEADVFIEGFRPGVVNKLGIDYKTLSKLNSKLIYCSITGFGQTGKYRYLPGHDVNFLGMAGILNLIGEKHGSPVIPGIQIADNIGGLNAAAGILLALYEREKSGMGQYIDISLTETSLSLLSLPLFLTKHYKQDIERGNWLLSHRYACYNIYETKDNRYLTIGCIENRFWKNLCIHLNREEFIELQFNEEKNQEISETLQCIFKQKTLDEWEEEFFELDICWSRIQNMDEVLKDPTFSEHNMVVDDKNEEGDITKTIGVPIKLDRTPGYIKDKPPKFGEHTKTILKSLNYTDEEIKELYEKNVI